MVNQENFAIANDKDSDCEINFFVYMRHATLVTGNKRGANVFCAEM
jgi:hypothetical protein